MKAKETPSAAKPGKPFPIVGIGASAGGLEALESFLTVLPKKFGVALIFIQHLSPKHKNLLPELLRSRTTDLQIEEIEDGLEILPGRLYLCPPAKEIRIRNGIFQMASRVHQHVHLPIDEFLASLAEDVAERAIAVILSGAGTDGARGVQAVRSAGGTVFVQDPATAEFPAMPLAAINTGQMDGVLPPQDIAREILKFHGSGIGGVLPETFASRVQFELFYRLVYEKTGYRFNHYKQSVVARRIKRRMSLLGASAVKDYLDMVADKDSEAALLAADLMIGVTSFFRDRLAWKALHLDVTRKLIARDDDSPIRVWTPACATGEEPYSIAMMLQQELDLAGKKREIQVFATDVNDRALERAREGIYPASIAADVPAGYMKKFFTPSENGLSVTVNKEIRQHIVFAKHDLLTDPPFSRLDLVICRNLLIYLEADAQEKCISLFHYALKEGGSLFLGGAESPGRNSALFIPLPHKKCRVYRKGETKRSARTPLAVPYAAERAASSLPIKQTSTTEYRQSAVHLIQEALLEEHAPAAVAIDQHYEILYHNGPTSRYLRQPRGTPTQNLLELLPKNLRNRLRGGLYRAAQEGKPISVRTSLSGEDEEKRHVTFRISKVRDDLFLIIFEEKGLFPEQKEATLLEAAAIEETAVHQLENELSATREDLQSHIEQLKSLNEELHSSNEELQAANEELETSREELQSLNEELITVNTQLQTKIEEEEETNNDLSNFLASANIPTIFLNQQFRVKRFTPAMSRLVTLIPGDIGRPIIDMSQEHLGPDLIADASAVLDQLTPIKKELAINGAWYVRTTLPYRTADNRIEGVVVTYVDISERKQAEEALRKATERERFLAYVLETAVVPFGIGAPDGSLILFNRAFAELTGYSKEELEKKGVTWAVDLTPPEWREREAAILDEARRRGQPVRYEKEYLRKNGSRVPIELSVEPVFDDAGNLKHYYSFLTDITERKRAEEALRESEQRVRLKLQSILSPEGDIGSLELADIIDAPAVQLLMDDFYQLARIPMAIIDLRGKVLVGAGWQDICTKFHRVHPDTCKHCVESDTLLSAGIPPGESRLYKCKNNMWDIATPIMMGGQHVGNIFSGQFFFEGETLDYEFFRLQARRYGFDEEEYIAALEAVPRLSKESVATGMAFFMKLAQTLSQLSYSNIKLARSLAQTDALMEALRRLAQFPEQNPNPVLRVALDGTLLYANPPARAMLEAMEATANGELPQPILTLVAETVEQKRAVEAELADSRGRTFWFGAAQPVGEEYINLYARDITERKGRENQIAELTRLYAVLSRVNETIVRTHDAESLFSEVCRIVADEGKFPLVWIGEVKGQEVAPAAWCGHAADYLKGIKVEVQGELGKGPTGTCIREKRAVVNDDFATNPLASPWREMAQRYGFRSSASFPIFRESNVVGAFTLYASESLAFDAEQVRLLESLSADLSYALDALNQEEALQKNLERLDIISSTASRLLASAEPQGIVEVLCRRVMEHLDCHAFFNFLVDEERNCLRLNAYAGIPEEAAQEIRFLDFGVAVCGCAARDACRIVAENIPTTPDIRTELVRSFGIKAYACHPLFAQGRIIGTLSFGTKSRLTFTDDELSLMKTVADQVATAMERVSLLQAAQERAEELGRLVEERTAALQLANAYHRSLIETSLDSLVTISPEGMITDVNTATERVTGYSRDALIGTDFSGYFTDPERARAGHRRVFKDGLLRDYEIDIRHQDGQVTPVLYNASVYRDGAGHVVGALAAARDITEHKQMDEQLRQAHKMEAIGTLAGGIAHDFNNILAIIIGNAELAMDEVSEEIGAHHNLEQIFKAGMRGRNLVRQILTFSRKTEHERKPLPLAPLVKETFDLLRASLPTTIGITLNLKTSEDMVLADATQIQQVLMNLCKNAADAMRATGGSLEVSLSETTLTDNTPLPESDMEPGVYVTLTVTDTGHGMDEEVQKKLFEPFFTTKEKGQGTGMGLAVVYGIVKAHHGAITVSSKPGRGSTFTVYLPQYVSDAKPEQKTTKGLTRGGKERILFVDDEEALVELGEYMLQRLGYQVVGKTDSMDALKTFAEHPEAFDLVITDQTMPQMTGAILARKLKAIRPDIPVILCTGYSETISPEEAESMGIQAFVMKPLSKDEAAETIRRVLGRNSTD